MQSVLEVLGDKGQFSKKLKGFLPRTAQIELAEAIDSTLKESSQLIAEAGTGTGKTFAYLVPAMLSGEKVIISTGTKNLQDQLFRKDLPEVKRILASPAKVALLKGRSNYLCLYRLERFSNNSQFTSKEQSVAYPKVISWKNRTKAGDINEVEGVDSSSSIWPLVTSTADNCLGQECDSFSKCYLVKARKEAQEADILVINHHLFFADMAIRDEGFGEVLPDANAFIFDEAHQLPEIATHFFGESISSRQLLELARDTEEEQAKDAPDMPLLSELAKKIALQAGQLRDHIPEKNQKGPWTELSSNEQFVSLIEVLRATLSELLQQLKNAAARGKGLESCYQRTELLSTRFTTYLEKVPTGHIQWYESYSKSFSLNLTPMDIGELFSSYLKTQKSAWIFTSATLAVADDFSHFQQRLGLMDVPAKRWESPFDFSRQAITYVPTDMPTPDHVDYTKAVVEKAIPVIEASEGRAFILFTSHRALNAAYEMLKDRLPYPLLVQGNASKSRLLDEFRSLGNAVLLATGSFWEGVDVKGEALSVVIIDKLPFSSPGDPVLQARIESMRQQGGNPFFDYQLPQAVISLKQGFGRLIRDVHDQGVLMMCDPRIVDKSYGKVFLNSLPNMTRTRRIEIVQRFFEKKREQKKVAI